MSRLHFILPISLLLSPLQAQAFHNGSSHYEHHELEIQRAKNELQRELLKYERQVQQAIDKFEEKTAHVWGDNTVLPDAHQDVIYRNNQTERGIINYEDGKVVVEIAVNIDRSSEKVQVAEQLSNAIADILLNGPDTRPIMEMAENPNASNSRNQGIAHLVDNEHGTALAKQDIALFSKYQSGKAKKQQITGRDGNVRYVFTTHFRLVPEHIKIRAQKFRKPVEFHAKKMRIPTPLIYAIMETESSFNPYAKSPVPAFGLMQLVPTTGARDAYKFLYNEDQVVREKYLYKPDQNIELGVAYLHVLYYKYLSRIEDPKSKLWAMIAAYNTGVMNVFRSFVGPYSRKKFSSVYAWKQQALRKINRMQPDEVYRYLKRNLPSEEARKYLDKVRSRMGKYRA